MHPHDTQERLFTDHPGSKRPRYAGEVPGQSSSLKPKNRAKWRRRKGAHRRRATLAARVAAKGGTGQGGMTS
jgi:hypothetical protein